MSIPLTNANWTTTLSAKISAVATSFTLDRSTDAEGTTLAGAYHLTFDEGTSKEEHMVVALAGATGTITTRGLSRVDAKTLVTGNRFEHDRGAEVKMTDIGLVQVINRLNGTEAFDSVALTGIASITGLSAPTTGTQAASKDYVDATVIAGAPVAGPSTTGIVRQADASQVTAGTASESGAILVASPDQMAAQIQSNSWLFGSTGGTASAATLTFIPAPTTLTHGMFFAAHITTALNAGATLNVAGLGAKALYKYAGGSAIAIEAGDCPINYHHVFVYDSDANVILVVNPANGTLTAAMQTEVQNFFSATDMTGEQAETLTGGPTIDAVDLHQHDPYTVGQRRLTANVLEMEFGLGDGVTISALGGITTRTAFNTRHYANGAGNDAGIEIELASENGTGASTDPAELADFTTVSFVGTFRFGAATGSDWFLGFRQAAVAAGVDPTTGNHFGFFCTSAGVLNASNANGTTQTKTDVSSGITLISYNTFEIINTVGTNIIFKINGTTVATHTTNMPTGAGMTAVYFQHIGTYNSSPFVSVMRHPATLKASSSV